MPRSYWEQDGVIVDDYLTNLVQQLWKYRRSYFADNGDWFDDRPESSPPVFAPDHADRNVLLRPGDGGQEARDVLGAIPVSRRHLWFRSMKGSQALAQSVFGNLMVSSKMDLLASLVGDDGEPLFIRRPGREVRTEMESAVDYLNKRVGGRTNVDVFIRQGTYKIAVECKLAEAGFGRCSRPLPGGGNTDYERDHCNGNYALQQTRPVNCSLAGVGVAYWEYIHRLFNGWSDEADQCPCPFNRAYQLTRSLLAASVRPDLSFDPAGGHAVLIYDSRNPSFQESGESAKVYDTVKKSLKNPALLQKTSWQQIVACLRQDAGMAWLVQGLADKYGIG